MMPRNGCRFTASAGLVAAGSRTQQQISFPVQQSHPQFLAGAAINAGSVASRENRILAFTFLDERSLEERTGFQKPYFSCATMSARYVEASAGCFPALTDFFLPKEVRTIDVSTADAIYSRVKS